MMLLKISEGIIKKIPKFQSMLKWEKNISGLWCRKWHRNLFKDKYRNWISTEICKKKKMIKLWYLAVAGTFMYKENILILHQVYKMP